MAGRMLETAAKLNKPLFLLVNTDGAVVSPESDAVDAPWSSDRGSASGMYLMYFNPNGRPSTTGFQLGHFTAGQSADEKVAGVGNPEAAAAAVFANYLAVNNRLDLFQSIVPSSIFESRAVDQVIKFG